MNIQIGGGYFSDILFRFIYVFAFLIMISSIFTGGYIYLKNQEVNNFTGLTTSSTNIDCFYFSICNMTGIGFGDIIPLTNEAKMLVSAQRLITIGIILIFFTPLSNEVPKSLPSETKLEVQDSDIVIDKNDIFADHLKDHILPTTSNMSQDMIGHTFIENTKNGAVLRTLLPKQNIVKY